MTPSESNDIDTLIRIAGGDHIALMALYDRYASTLLALTQRIVGAGAEAEELVHDVFLEVWCHADMYQPHHGTVRSWLVMRTRTHALAALHTLPELAAQVGTPHTLQEGPDAPAVVEENDDSPLADERRVARQALNSLTPDQGRVFDLAFLAGRSVSDMAQGLQMREDTVLGHLQAVQEALAQSRQTLRRA